MSLNNYQPIKTASTKQTFSDYIESLDIPQIDYFAIGIQNRVTCQSISLMSLPEWQKHFTENGYANHDPIRKATLYTKRNFIPFCEIDFVDNFGKEIMKKRSNMGIKNGIILMERFAKFNYMVTLGTGFSSFDAFDFINRYYNQLHLIKNDLISLVEKDTHFFLPKIISEATHLSTDAK